MGESSSGRRYEFPIFDADNHLYETRDAFTRYLPPEYEGLIGFADINGRQTLVVRNKLSFVLPNPTLEKVPPPGWYANQDSLPRIIASPPEFFEPEPRLRWMRETGIDRAVLFPTLGLSVEGRLEDPDERCAVVHAFNRWLLDQWTFGYERAIYAAPLVSLSRIDRALEELEWVVGHGAPLIYVQPGFVVTERGRASMALPEFDPFWRAVEDAGVMVAMHAGDGGQDRYLNEWEGTPGADTEYFKKRSRESAAFRAFMGVYDRITTDLVGSMICHGMLTRFPKLTVLLAEQATGWVRPTVTRLEEMWSTGRHLLDEHPMDVFRRSLKVHLFMDRDPVGLARQLGSDVVVFGSDFPHPEGQANPLDFADRLDGLSHDDVTRIMGGTLARVMDAALGATAP